MLLAATSVLAVSPTVLSVTPNATGQELYVRFSEPVCPYFGSFGATHIPNYALTPSATISTATMLSDQVTVKLNLPVALSGSYVLTLNPLPGKPVVSCVGSNFLIGPVATPFLAGPPTGPVVYYVSPNGIGTDCSSSMTVNGSGFDATATVELLPGPIAGVGVSVNGAGTTLTATFPAGIAPGAYALVVKNPAGATVFPGQNSPAYSIPVLPVTIQSSWPSQVSSCSLVTITANGVGFCPGATFQAKTPSTTVSGTSVIISPAGDQISATFDFSLAPGGSYDLEVKNSGGGTATRANALQTSGLYTYAPFPDRVGDCGVQTLQIVGSLCAGDNVRLVPVGAGSIIPGTVVSIVPSGFWGDLMTASFNFAGATPGVYHLEVQRGASPWSFSNGAITVLATSPCPLDIQVLGRTTVGFSIVNSFTIQMQNLSCATVPASTLTVTVPALAAPVITSPSAGGVVSPANVVTYAIPSLSPGAVYSVSFQMLVPTLGSSFNLSVVDSTSGCGPVLHPITVVASQDPNFKKGLDGKGAARRIRGDEMMPYEIHFENLSSATAPAQDVFISDRLNPALFDLSTFSLGDITFGNHTSPRPPD